MSSESRGNEVANRRVQAQSAGGWDSGSIKCHSDAENQDGGRYSVPSMMNVRDLEELNGFPGDKRKI